MRQKGEILVDILRGYDNCYLFLHNTKNLTVVQRILEDGLVFEYQLSNTTDRVSPADAIEVSFFFFQRKDYGDYTIIIAIPRKAYLHYVELSRINNVSLEETLSITKPYLGENDELIYKLSPKHILGYFDGTRNIFIENSGWDPEFIND